ncbi:hypothetical protein A9Q86_12160 [Flavobacteriales bacterium 33_180_T64]|nr:hypothetical protein A9Q86_12160 [Flavobacteriales bacterium 33_180_T64]
MTKEKALTAGLELFSQKGYSNVGLAEILKTAEIPKGSFYHHFKSKEAFAIQVLEKYSNCGLNNFKSVLLEQKELSPKDRIIAFYSDKANEFEDKEFVKGCLLGDSCSEGGVSDEFKEFVDEQLKKWQSTIELCLGEGKENNQISKTVDTRMMASVILNGWEGAISRMKSSKSRQPLDDFIQSLDLLI